MTIVHEDAVRFVRQRLLALEEGREDDAKTIEKFLADEFGVTVIDTTPGEQPASRQEAWRNIYGLPAGVERVSVIVEYNREPIWRVPVDLEARQVSGYEVPLHLAPVDPLLPAPSPADLPEQLRPREAGDLPPRIRRAIRLPDAEPTSVPAPAEEPS